MKLIEVDRYYTRLPKSINNHSVRVFVGEYEGLDGVAVRDTVKTYLDRITDISPRCFEAYNFFGEGCSQSIKINGQRFFGSGLSWKKAIALLEAYLESA